MTLKPKKGYLTGNYTVEVSSITRQEEIQRMTDEAQTETAADLEAKLGAIRAQEAEEREAAVSNPILDQIKASEGDTFIDKLRQVAGNLKEAGKIGESDLLAGGEEGSVVATLIKLVGEIVDHV
jgi:hypothetical protein